MSTVAALALAAVVIAAARLTARRTEVEARILAVRQQSTDDALWQAHAAMWRYEQQAWVLAGRPMHEVAK